MKKIFSTILMLLLSFNTIIPCFAQDDEQNSQTEQNSQMAETPMLVSEIEDKKIYLMPKSVYNLELESDLDINDADKNEEIYFRLASPVKLSDGELLPEDTRFVGKFKKLSPSKPVFKIARAYIIVDKILLPNEQSYTLRMEPKKGSDLKSSQFLNILQAIPSGIGVITFSVVSVATVAVESASVVGLVVVPRTCKGFGLLISSMAKGINYKAKAGKVIQFKLDSPVYLRESDVK